VYAKRLENVHVRVQDKKTPHISSAAVRGKDVDETDAARRPAKPLAVSPRKAAAVGRWDQPFVSIA